MGKTAPAGTAGLQTGTADDDIVTRGRRARSWYERGAAVHEADKDLAFILYWIAFNAACASDDLASEDSERRTRQKYFERLPLLDRNAIHHSMWDSGLRSNIRDLLNNKYLFHEYWGHLNGRSPDQGWETWFRRARHRANGAPKDERTRPTLNMLFDRLYILRNQLLHGGATWNSPNNRNSVETGAQIMKQRTPIFIGIMRENPTQEWGRLWYPPGLQGRQRPDALHTRRQRTTGRHPSATPTT